MRSEVSWSDLRERARQRLPRVVFDYIDGGADDEFTSRENRRAFEDLSFCPRVLAGIGERSQAVEVLGQSLAMPVITAPTGVSRVAGRAGELAAARAATAVGTISILSAATSVPLQEVAEAAPSQWFQLYPYRDPQRTVQRIAEAAEAGFRALVVTVDAPVPGNRERDRRNGLSVPIRVRPRMAWSVLRRPRWLADYLTGPPLVQHHDRPPGSGGGTPAAGGRGASLASTVQELFNDHQTWADLERVRTLWDGPLVLKGVMCAQDARRAVDAGCDGIVVSNHGGRQLDGLPATIDVLPEVVDAVAGDADVLLDGGVRRGTDVVKALALGAKACLIGRPWLFGLATGGERGVQAVLEGLAAEIDRTLALVGVPEATALDGRVLRRRPGSGWMAIEAETR
jgi:isopentenyl diphosphate isomerase/L-lactate dehydrogenase-like FMN-dependent dehydrogenase